MKKFYLRNKNLSALIFLIPIILAGCKDFQDIEVGSPTSISVKSIQDNRINVDLSIPISNPNNLSFKVTKIDMEVIVNDNYLGQITNADNVLIKANSNDTYLFDLELEVKNVVKGIISMVNVFSSGSVVAETSGYIKARSGFVVKSIPVENSASIKVRNRIPFLKER
jgi:LEA14-like dessication related protein